MADGGADDGLRRRVETLEERVAEIERRMGVAVREAVEGGAEGAPLKGSRGVEVEFEHASDRRWEAPAVPAECGENAGETRASRGFESASMWEEMPVMGPIPVEPEPLLLGVERTESVMWPDELPAFEPVVESRSRPVGSAVPAVPMVEIVSPRETAGTADPTPRDNDVRRRGDSLESRIGRNWAGWVGAVVLFLGVGFFLKYAWQHEWINPSPTARVISTVLFGCGLAGVGEWLYRKPMRGLAGVLYGAGVAVGMAGFFGAHAYFTPPVMGSFPAGVGVVMMAGAGIGLALRADLVVVAVLALLGAYLSPWILRGQGDRSAMLLGYLAMLSAVGWVLTVKKPAWSVLRGFTWVCSFAWYGLWWVSIGRHGGHQGLALLWLAAMYAGYLAEMFVSVQREVAGGVVVIGTEAARREATLAALSFVNAGVVALGIFGLFRANQPLAGALLLGMAGVQGWIAAGTSSKQMRYSAILQAASLTTLAVPLMMDEFAITLAWGVMAVGIAILGRRADVRWARIWGVVLILLATARVVILDHFNPALGVTLAHVGVEPVSRWLLLGWGVCVALHAVGWMGATHAKAAWGDVKVERGRSLLAALGTVLFVAFTRAEWGPGAAITLAGMCWLVAIVGLVKKGARVGYVWHAWALLTLLGIKWFIADGVAGMVNEWEGGTTLPFLNLACACGLLLGVIAAWLANQMERPEIKSVVARVACLLGFISLNFEICRLVNVLGSGWSVAQLVTAKQLTLSFLWAATALVVSILTRRPGLKWVRGVAIGMFVAALVRVMAFGAEDVMRVAMGSIHGHAITRWLVVMCVMAVGSHVLGWVVLERTGEEIDPTAASLAGIGTVAYLMGVIGTWGFGVATTLAGIGWLCCLLPWIKRGSGVGYGRHAWLLAAVIGMKWFCADGVIRMLAAWGRPGRDLLAPVLNMPTLAAVILAAVVTHLGRATREMESFTSDVDHLVAGRVAAGLIGFAWLNFEVCRTINYFGGGQGEAGLMMAKHVGLSTLWAVIGLAGISAGFAKDWKRMRYAALGLLGVTLVKVLLIDMAGVETIWRILSFMGVGALLLCVSFVYYRHEATSRRQIGQL